MKLKPIATGLTALFAFAAGSAQAQISNDTIKIGDILIDTRVGAASARFGALSLLENSADH